MTIPRDDKDWTWVLDRPCPECGLDLSWVLRNGSAPTPAAHSSEGMTAGAGASDSAPLSSSRPAGESSGLPAGPLGEVEWSFTRFPDGRIVLEVPDAPH